MLIEDGLFDSGYQFSVLMDNVYFSCQALSTVLFYLLFKQIKIEKSLSSKNKIISSEVLTLAGRLCFIAYVIFFILLASGDYGISNWLINPRTGYQLHRTGQGHWFALAISFWSASYLFHFLSKPTPKALIRSTLIHFFAAYFFGSKGILLALFGATIVFLWIVKWPHLIKFLVTGLPIIFGVLLVNLYLALSEGFSLQSIFEYFDYYMNAANYYRLWLNNEIHLFGGEIILSSLWNYIPRGFWPDKPTTYGILIINEIFYPGQAELTNTPAFAGAVEQFADFGIFGVILYGLFGSKPAITALLSYLFFRRPGFNVKAPTLTMTAIALIFFAPSFGDYFPSALYLIILAATLATIKFAQLIIKTLKLSTMSPVRFDYKTTT